MGLRGNLQTLSGFKRRIAAFPKTLAVDVARRAAPALTGLTRDAFSSGRNVYGEARPLGKGGRQLSLEKTGDTRRGLHFAQIGTIVRCVLGPKYARFLIGKYGILPNGGAIPAAWSRRLGEILTSTTVRP